MSAIVDRIIRYESGEAGAAETLELFAELIATGAAWSLQGSYVRAAASLIEAGHIAPDGTINPETLAELEA